MWLLSMASVIYKNKFIYYLIIFGVVLYSFWFLSKSPKSPDEFSKELVGIDAVSCGTYPICKNYKEVFRCMNESLQISKPFYAWFSLNGLDSNILVGVAGSANSEIYLTGFDSDPSGGMQIGGGGWAELCRTSLGKLDGTLSCDTESDLSKLADHASIFTCNY